MTFVNVCPSGYPAVHFYPQYFMPSQVDAVNPVIAILPLGRGCYFQFMKSSPCGLREIRLRA